MSDELTTRQAAERLEESDRLVRLWCQQGRFPGAHLVTHPRGDYWLIPVRDLENFVKPKPGPVPKLKLDSATERKRAARKAITRWEGEGGATIPPTGNRPPKPKAKKATKKGGKR